jgi:hypothetical protein
MHLWHRWGQKVIPRRVHYSATVLFNEIGDDLLVCFEGLDGGGFIVLHQTAVTGHVGAENGGELAVKAFLLHGGTSALLKVHHVAKGLLLSGKDAGGAKKGLPPDREAEGDYLD